MTAGVLGQTSLGGALVRPRREVTQLQMLGQQQLTLSTGALTDIAE
jgi:hypothetical protein